MKMLMNAVIFPFIGNMDAFSGGLYDSSGSFVEDSLLWRGKPAKFTEPTEHLAGTYIYGGCLFGHFGHFIWESLARLYAIRRCKNYPVLFINPNKYNKFFDMMFRTINVKNDIIILEKPVSVENLIFAPPMSSIFPPDIADKQIRALQCFTPVQKESRKIWISRSWLKMGILDNESILENELNKIGYEIIHPEKLLLREQIDLISKADIVAGLEGYAFFSVLFSKKIYGKFYIFNRRISIPETIPYVFDKMKINYETHTFALEPIIEEWPYSIYHQPDISNIISVLSSAQNN